MPTGLKITIVFNFIAVAILCSIASIAEPTKIASKNDLQAPLSSATTAPNLVTDNTLETMASEENASANIDRDINQSVDQNRDATPAPWVIRADGSVQWLDAQ